MDHRLRDRRGRQRARGAGENHPQRAHRNKGRASGQGLSAKGSTANVPRELLRSRQRKHGLDHRSQKKLVPRARPVRLQRHPFRDAAEHFEIFQRHPLYPRHARGSVRCGHGRAERAEAPHPHRCDPVHRESHAPAAGHSRLNGKDRGRGRSNNERGRSRRIQIREQRNEFPLRNHSSRRIRLHRHGRRTDQPRQQGDGHVPRHAQERRHGERPGYHRRAARSGSGCVGVQRKREAAGQGGRRRILQNSRDQAGPNHDNLGKHPAWRS